MTIPPERDHQPGVVITLREVWEQGQETREIVGGLAADIGELVAVNRRLDSHSKTLVEHDGRLDKLEIAQAVVAAQQRPRTPWYVTIGAIVGIVTGLGALITLMTMLGQISAALTP